MTMPKSFSLSSKNFNINTMSYEENPITTINSSLSYQERQHHQSSQNCQQEILSSVNPLSTKMAALAPMLNSTNADKNTTMREENTNLNDNVDSSKNQDTHFVVENIMPGIYLTKDFISCKEEQLRAHRFTHIIIIDKHIQELYYPNQQPDIFKLCCMSNEKTKNLEHDNSSSLNAFDYYCPPSIARNHLTFGKEFEVIDLNFGEKAYLTKVLPNCYKAVMFINKALQSRGTILVIDCNGGEQKCLTIIVAYLMYKNNISFSNAFARLKEFYNKADLDRFYISQLYEYEPILQVQRAQSRGQSSTRVRHAAILKRKKTCDDVHAALDNNIECPITSTATSSLSCYAFTTTNTSSTYTYPTTPTTARELLNNCNPLNRFDSAQMERQALKQPNHAMTQDHNHNNTHHIFTRFMSGMSSSPTTVTTTGGWYNWDDNAME